MIINKQKIMLPQYTYLTKNVYLSLTDEYFVSNIEKVDSVTLLRKDKVMNGVSWSMRFQQALSTWPCLNDLGASAVQVKTFFANFSCMFQNLNNFSNFNSNEKKSFYLHG